jgi:biopolymer transport protein ExbD
VKIERKKRNGSGVYTASLNDIMFFLLLFFLIISTMATPMALKVALPESSTPEKVAVKKTINVAVTYDRRYFVEDREVALDGMAAEITRIAGDVRGDDGPNILLQVDKAVDVQTMVQVLDIGNSLNIHTTVVVNKN